MVLTILDSDRFTLLGALTRGQSATRPHDANTCVSERARQLFVLLGSSLLGCAAHFEVRLADHDEIPLLDRICSRQPGAMWCVNGRDNDLIPVGGDAAVARELVWMRGAAAHGPVCRLRTHCQGRRIKRYRGLHCGALLAWYMTV
jgi:hypothetical protein